MKNGHMAEETLENSDLYFKAEEEGWTTFCKGAAVTLQPIGESSVSVCAKTGVFATGETDTALMALMNHLGGWIQKVEEYGFSPDGEVVLTIERDLADGESIDRTVSLAASYVSQHTDTFRNVNQGVPLDAAIGSGPSSAGGLLRALRNELLE